ncbi:RNA polymerase sigma factor region1.1 domain-containing protein, partial [Candidatus Peregrinibacteria bacterium]|nr:RNA polymerase sigma factor region1.1 domain-containing protein [Candidatus Peregrinibacteria bacterium]
MAKKITKKFIAQPDEKTLAKYPKSIRELIQKGREQRFVTHQELLRGMPEIENNVILLDEIYTLFLDLGIEVIDVKNDRIWGKNVKKGGAGQETEEDWLDLDQYYEEEEDAGDEDEKDEKGAKEEEEESEDAEPETKPADNL